MQKEIRVDKIKKGELMKENIIKGVANLVCIIKRLIHTLLFFVSVCIIFTLYPIGIVVLIPICGIIQIITGKSLYFYILDFPDKIYVLDDFLIKLLRINNERKY